MLYAQATTKFNDLPSITKLYDDNLHIIQVKNIIILKVRSK